MSSQRQRRTSFVGAARRIGSDDSGIAMLTVVGVSVVLFILATMLLVLSGHLTTMTAAQVASTKAMHMADAGLNAYLYELRRDPTFYVANPTLGPTSLDDGVWTVQASATGGPGSPIDIVAVGSIPSYDVTRTVRAEVRFPSYADYMFLSDSNISIGSEARIVGSIRANGWIENKGTVTDNAFAGGSVTDTASGTDPVDGLPKGVRGSKMPNQPDVDFSQVTTDLNAIRILADSAGTSFGSSGSKGYQVVMNGTQVEVLKVTGGDTTGDLKTTSVGLYPVPASGVFYFNDNVWVRGTYSTKLTIASTRIMRINGNIEPSDETRPFTCGLIAQDNINVPSWYPITAVFPTDVVLQAALLSQTGTVQAEMQTGVFRNSIHIKGSNAYQDQGGFVSVSGTKQVAGFRSRLYEYDRRLEVEPPPMYPRLRDGTLRVSTWFEGA